MPIVPTQGITPCTTPVMTVILPSYPTFTVGSPSIYPPCSPSMLPQAAITMTDIAPSIVPFSKPFVAQPGLNTQDCMGPLFFSPRATSFVGEEAAEPQALFSSPRSSSPLQLNLLQEELPKLTEGLPSTGDNHAESLLVLHANQCGNPSESGNQAQPTSSELLDLLLQEDARSRTGSNASGGESGASLRSGSGSKGTSTSHTGKREKRTHETCKNQEARPVHQHGLDTPDSLCRTTQHTPERVMMTYQIHNRDHNEVLAEDREKVWALQPLQPWFKEQREELAEVYPWIQPHTVPEKTQGCGSCNSGPLLVHSPHPTALCNLCPLELPHQDCVGPLVDT
ncbi:LOW QUALITY PROTEIN: period circadian protein homolog 2-like [Spinachia spinachia]